MKLWIRNNKSVVYFIILFLVLFVTLGLMQGCDLEKLIKVDAPPAVLAVVDLPEGEMTLAEADLVWKQWQAYVEFNSEAFQKAVQDAENRYAFISSMFNTGLGIGQGVLGEFPGGALILSLLTGGAGLMMKRPKEDTRVAQEKEASYNKGLEVGKQIAAELIKDKNPNT